MNAWTPAIHFDVLKCVNVYQNFKKFLLKFLNIFWLVLLHDPRFSHRWLNHILMCVANNTILSEINFAFRSNGIIYSSQYRYRLHSIGQINTVLLGGVQKWRVWTNYREAYKISWWRHQMETLSALLAICAGNSPVPGDFPAQRPVTRRFDVFFDLRLN